jgi:cytoskeleton protein RodZ
MALPKRFRTFTEEASDRTAAASFEACVVGDTLRQRRQQLCLELGDVAAALRIRPAYLEALEQDRLNKLPAPVYAIGFLRSYADYLGLDGAEVVRRFKQASTGLTAKPDLSFSIRLGEARAPRGGALLVAMILAICGYGAWFYLSGGERSRLERVAPLPAELAELLRANPEPGRMQPVLPLPAQVVAAPPTAVPAMDEHALAGSTTRPLAGSAAASSPSFRPNSNAAASLSAVSPAAGRPSEIIIRATAASWVQISDRKRSVLVARVLKPGESYEVPDEPGLTMRTGNAGGLDITVGGNPVPPVGPTGAVRRKVALDPRALAEGTAVSE